MNCPHCGRAEADGAAECSACGVIFAKWKARDGRGQAAAPRLDIPDGGALLDSPPANELLRYRRIAMGVAAAVSVVLSIVISRMMHRAGGAALKVLATQQPALKATAGAAGSSGRIDPAALMKAMRQGPNVSLPDEAEPGGAAPAKAQASPASGDGPAASGAPPPASQ